MILRSCLAWLQLCIEQLHSKTTGGASSGWSWRYLDVVFGYEGVLNSKKHYFQDVLPSLSLVCGTHMSYSFFLVFLFLPYLLTIDGRRTSGP